MHPLQTFPVVNDDKILQIFFSVNCLVLQDFSKQTNKLTKVEEYTTRGWYILGNFKFSFLI